MPQGHRWHVGFYKITDLFGFSFQSAGMKQARKKEVWTWLGYHSCNSCCGAVQWVHSGPPTLLHILVYRKNTNTGRTEALGPSVALVSMKLHSGFWSRADPPPVSCPLPGSSSAPKCCLQCSSLYHLRAQGKASLRSACPIPGSQTPRKHYVQVQDELLSPNLHFYSHFPQAATSQHTLFSQTFQIPHTPEGPGLCLVHSCGSSATTTPSVLQAGAQ